ANVEKRVALLAGACKYGPAARSISGAFGLNHRFVTGDFGELLRLAFARHAPKLLDPAVDFRILEIAKLANNIGGEIVPRDGVLVDLNVGLAGREQLFGKADA